MTHGSQSLVRMSGDSHCVIKSVMFLSVCFAILRALSDITQFISGRFCGRTSFVALKIAWAHDPSEFTARL